MFMRTLAAIAPLLLALTSSFVTAAEPEVQREILGLRLDMTKEEVETRLKEIGKFVRDERKQQQVWEAKDKSFSHVIVGYEKAGPGLRYVTAVAREDKDAERIRYSDVEKLEAARQAGDPKIKNFNYEWTLPPGERTPGDAGDCARTRRGVSQHGEFEADRRRRRGRRRGQASRTGAAETVGGEHGW